MLKFAPVQTVNFWTNEIASDHTNASLTSCEWDTTGNGDGFSERDESVGHWDDLGFENFACHHDGRIASLCDENLIPVMHHNVLCLIPFMNELIEIDGKLLSLSDDKAFK